MAHYKDEFVGLPKADGTIPFGKSPITKTPMSTVMRPEDAHDYKAALEFAETRNSLYGYDSRKANYEDICQNPDLNDGGWHLMDYEEANYFSSYNKGFGVFRGTHWTSVVTKDGSIMVVDFDNKCFLFAKPDEKHLTQLVRSEPKPLFSSAQGLCNLCHKEFAAFVAQGIDLNDTAIPSHLCIRSANKHNYAEQKRWLKDLAKNLDTVYTSQHGGKEITWAELAKPLVHEQFQINYLELTDYNPEKNDLSGPQMLVCAVDNFSGDVQKITVREEPLFILRYQQNSAEKILGLA